VLWLVAALLLVLLLVIVFPDLALWLPRALGY
jgi:TRAP-type C4-dicarboxylate transport system permease large subunit